MTKKVLVSYFSEPTTNLLLINSFIDVIVFRKKWIRAILLLYYIIFINVHQDAVSLIFLLFAL